MAIVIPLAHICQPTVNPRTGGGLSQPRTGGGGG